MRLKHFLVNSKLQSSVLIMYGLIYVIIHVYLHPKYLDFAIIGLISVVIGLIDLSRRKLLKPLRTAFMTFYFVSFILATIPIIDMYGFTGSVASFLFITAALIALFFSLLSLFSK